MNKLPKHDVIVNAIERAKASEFGVTGIKVELEAQLERDGDWRDESECYSWIMERLQDLGLAEYREGEWHHLSEHDDSQVETCWYPVWPLTYADFYNDGSVDSELTFSVALDDPQHAFLLPKILAIWNDFMRAVAEDCGYEPDVSGAGMHTAFLNTARCTYPSRFASAQVARFSNFKRSMTLLLPSLYFLASSDATSRPMQYREPKIEMYDGGHSWSTRTMEKFCAITYNQGALEFRIFNTCYDSPDVILDNLVVMANSVTKYWRKTYRDPGLTKITRRTHFGNDSGRDLQRLYVTAEHVDLLNEGLKRLKPSYYSVKELKAQRSFRINKRQFNNVLGRIKQEAKLQYKEYEARFRWEQSTNRYSLIRDFIQSRLNDYQGRLQQVNEAEIVADAEKYADQRLAEYEQRKQTLEAFIEEQVMQHRDRSSSGARWELAVR